MFSTNNPTLRLLTCKALFDQNYIDYRQLSQTKLEVYVQSPYYDKVFFYPRSGKLKGITYLKEDIKVMKSQQELLDTIKQLARGLEL